MSNQLGSLNMGQKLKKTPAGEIPVEWDVVRLEDVASNVEKRISPAEAGDCKYIGLEHIESSTARLISVGKAADVTSLKTVFEKRDVLFGKLRPNLKKVLIAPFSGVCSTDIMVFRAKAKMCPDYLFYAMQTNDAFDFALHTAGGTKMPRTSWNLFKKYVFPCPNLSEQKRISEILISIDSFIDAVSAEIETTQKFKKGLMCQLLTRGIGHKKFKKTEIGEIPVSWRLVAFDDVFSFLRNGSNSRDELTDTGNVGYVHYGDLHTKWQTKLDCSEVELPKIEARLIAGLPFLENGDLIIADASEDYAGVGVAVETANVGEQKIVAGLHTMLLRDKTKVFVDGFRGYIQYIPAVHNSLVRVATGGSVYGISKSNVQTVKIPCPPHKEQEQIRGILAELASKLRHQKIYLDKILNLKLSLMSALLTGKVRVLK